MFVRMANGVTLVAKDEAAELERIGFAGCNTEEETIASKLDLKATELRAKLLAQSRRPVHRGSQIIDERFVAHGRIEYTGGVSDEMGSYDVVSFPGKYGALGWGAVVAYAQDPDVNFSAATVFLPDERSDGFGEHVTNPETPGKCWCHALYGESKPFGCFWFEIWMSNVKKAVRLGHKLVVYFFNGQKGVGKVDWDDLAEHSKLCDSVLEGLSSSSQQKVRATQEYPFNGLGGSQKGEVAWLDRQGYEYDEIDISGFIGSSRSTLTGRISPGVNTCIVSFDEATYPHTYHCILTVLIDKQQLNSSFVYYPPATPLYGSHWYDKSLVACRDTVSDCLLDNDLFLDDTTTEVLSADAENGCDCRCICSVIYGFETPGGAPGGCVWFKKTTANIKQAVAADQKLVFLYSKIPGDPDHKPIIPAWKNLGKSQRERLLFTALLRNRLAAMLMADPAHDPCPAASSVTGDDSIGENCGSEWSDMLAAIFRPLLSTEEVQQARTYAGLAISQTAEASWIEHMGLPYELVDTVEWIKANQQHRVQRSDADASMFQYHRGNSVPGEEIFDDRAGLTALGEGGKGEKGDIVPTKNNVYQLSHYLVKRWVTRGSLI
jgi:hypothetical protein